MNKVTTLDRGHDRLIYKPLTPAEKANLRGRGYTEEQIEGYQAQARELAAARTAESDAQAAAPETT